tara:strand:- start:252 stop:476 length:225 start_codon:yes stop_codon:yes gene_type:complete
VKSAQTTKIQKTFKLQWESRALTIILLKVNATQKIILLFGTHLKMRQHHGQRAFNNVNSEIMDAKKITTMDDRH